MRNISATLKRPNVFTEHVILWGHQIASTEHIGALIAMLYIYIYILCMYIYIHIYILNFVCMRLLYENQDNSVGVFTCSMYFVIIFTRKDYIECYSV